MNNSLSKYRNVPLSGRLFSHHIQSGSTHRVCNVQGYGPRTMAL